MSKICNSFDAFFDRWHQPLWRLCFVMTRGKASSQELAFQALLRLGAAKDPDIGEEEAQTLLFQSALRLGEDYFTRRPHRMPKAEALRRLSLPFPVTNGLYALMKLPLSRRCALCLGAQGFSPQQIAALMRIRPSRAQRLCREPDIPGWREDLLAVRQTQEDVRLLSDRVYERFEVRSVGVENAIHSARQAFDRAAPYLALLVLALFALSIGYVSR